MKNKPKLYYDLGTSTSRKESSGNTPGEVNGNNNAIGNEARVSVNESDIILRLVDELHHQHAAHQKEVDRLLSIIEKLTNK